MQFRESRSHTSRVQSEVPKVGDEKTGRHPRLRILLVQGIVELVVGVKDRGDVVYRPSVVEGTIRVDGEVCRIIRVGEVDRETPDRTDQPSPPDDLGSR